MQMSMEAKAAWPMLWTECDDQGVFEWKPIVLKARIFPADNVDFSAVLAEYETLNCIRKITMQGKSYGLVRNFRKFQRPKKPNSTFPLPDEFRTYVALDKPSSEPSDDEDGGSSEPVPHQFPTGTENPPQMEDGGCSKNITSTVDTSVSTSEVPPAQPAALSADRSDEDLFWSLAKECEAKGITRSRLGKLLKLVQAGATSMSAATRLVQSCLKAKDPSTYFGATIRELEDEAGITRTKQMAARKKVPPWVDEWRQAGETVTPIGPNQWSSRGNVYDDEGRLTGW